MRTKSIFLTFTTLASALLFTNCGTTSGYKQADKTNHAGHRREKTVKRRL